MDILIVKSDESDSRIPARTAGLVVDQLAAVNGVALHTRVMMQEIMQPFTIAMENIERRMDRYNPSPATSMNVNTNYEVPRYRTFFWDGLNHFYPKDFKLPVVSSVALWRLWLFGDDNAVNIPYHNLDGKHMTKSQRTQFSKARGVMDYVRKSIGKTYPELIDEGFVEAERQFSDHYLILMGRFKRHATMSFSTVYKHIRTLSTTILNDDQVDFDDNRDAESYTNSSN